MQLHVEWKLDSAKGTLYQYDPRYDADKVVMDYLKMGQGHNAGAMASYDECRRQQSSIFAFMILVVSAAPGLAGDFAGAQINIGWQRQNNPGSLSDAKGDWNQAAALSDVSAQYYFKVSAMKNLMWGQRHNIAVMRLYRACFRDNQSGLFALV